MDDLDINSTEEDKPQREQKQVPPVHEFAWSNQSQTGIMIQALSFMNVLTFTYQKGLRTNKTVYRYMYKKNCKIQEDIGSILVACPWCYSSTKKINKIESDPNASQVSVSKTACRSADFEHAVDLAVDVHARLQHHIKKNDQLRPSAGIRWDHSELPNLIAQLFFPNNNNANKTITSAVEAMMKEAADDGAAGEEATMKEAADDGAAGASSIIQISEVSGCVSIAESDDIVIVIQSASNPAETAAASETLHLRESIQEHEVSAPILDQRVTADSFSLPDAWQNEKDECVFLKNVVYKRIAFAKGTASCHEAWDPKRGAFVCVKVISIKKRDTTDREIDMLNYLMQYTGNKPELHNLVSFHGYQHTHEHSCLIFEMVLPSNNFRTDLKKLLQSQVVVYMRELLKALVYLHRYCNIVHRDVKPENFVHHFDTNTFRLIDFGSAKHLDSDHRTVASGGGTRGFRAPEILGKSMCVTPAVDVWSAGIILLSLLTGQNHNLQDHPKASREKRDQMHLDEIGNIVGLSEMRKLNLKEATKYGSGLNHEGRTGWAAKATHSQSFGRTWMPDDSALDLLSRMLDVSPSHRISSADALAHPFLRTSESQQDASKSDGSTQPPPAPNAPAPAGQTDAIRGLPNGTKSDGSCEAGKQQPPPNAPPPAGQTEAIRGLPNDNYWCYSNAVLICFKLTVELTSNIQSSKNQTVLIMGDINFGIAQALRLFLVSDNDHQNASLLQVRQNLAVRDKRYDGLSMQCSADVCDSMLEAMRSAHFMASPTDVVQYNLDQQLACMSCNHKSFRQDKQLMLHVALHQDMTLES